MGAGDRRWPAGRPLSASERSSGRTPRSPPTPTRSSSTSSARPVRVVVRHSFAAGWTVRVERGQSDRRPRRHRRAGPDLATRRGSGLGRARPGPPARTRSRRRPATGRCSAACSVWATSWPSPTSDSTSVRCASRPSGATSTQWRWDWYASPVEFAADRQPQIPRSLFVEPDEPFAITADEDTAIVLPAGRLRGAPGGTGRADLLEAAGRFPVELVSARGRTSFALLAADPLDELIVRAGEQALAAPANPSGIVPLADVHAALAVQHGLEIGRGRRPLPGRGRPRPVPRPASSTTRAATR